MNDIPDKNIQVLSFAESIRRRPAMYIGDVKDRGIFNLFKELVFQLLNDPKVKYLDISIKQNNTFKININHPLPFKDRPSIVNFLTRIIPGKETMEKLPWVCSCILSEEFTLWIKKGDNVIHQSFSEGIPVNGKTKFKKSEKKGTEIAFQLDKSIFQSYNINDALVKNYLSRISCFFPEKKISYVNEETNEQAIFISKNGLPQLFQNINILGNPITRPIIISGKDEDLNVEIIFTYNYSQKTQIHSYVNKHETPEHGVHLKGFLKGLKKYLTTQGSKENPEIKKGLVAIISIDYPNPHWGGSVKWELVNPELIKRIQKITQMGLKKLLDNDSDTRNKITEKVINNNQFSHLYSL